MTHPERSRPSLPSVTEDLIHGSLAAWSDSPMEAFEVWMDSRKLADSSRVVYRSQWAGFVQYLDSHGVGFDRVDSSLIRTYLEGTEIKLEQRERIHRLIERAFNAIANNRLAATNPAASAAVARRQSWRLAERNDDTDFLDESDHKSAITWIESVQAPQVRRPKATTEVSSGRAPRAWVFSRNRAACAVLLAGGLKPSELRELAVNEVYCESTRDDPNRAASNDIQGRLLEVEFNEGADLLEATATEHAQAVNEEYDRASSVRQLGLLVRGTSTTRERRLRLPAYASAALASWISALRATAPGAAAEGFPLFPRGSAGGRLSVRSIEYLVEGFFEGFARQEGAGESRITPQLLRNSFAAGLFARGVQLDDVQERMGYLIDDSARRLQAAWRLATAQPD
ncbi:site-specific integrase (plasmid) [Achromobacter seleniivolatilans]|uniref:Site-specific integrase n=1 Tax=Achromobacter seleniivolatilans TaxID=3047478 RepID=A0ABY9MBP0_9BURK|nr:site-specific integrase [Achromobacter sp. R39]WMD24057.1 site-specific integrase [Achromobacter sp. R39]